jgi:hypothetical protein
MVTSINAHDLVTVRAFPNTLLCARRFPAPNSPALLAKIAPMTMLTMAVARTQTLLESRVVDVRGTALWLGSSLLFSPVGLPDDWHQLDKRAGHK